MSNQKTNFSRALILAFYALFAVGCQTAPKEPSLCEGEYESLNTDFAYIPEHYDQTQPSRSEPAVHVQRGAL